MVRRVAAWFFGALALLSGTAHGQDNYPNRTVRVIVPYAAGGGADAVARVIAAKLSERLGQQFFVDNRPGGVGNVGSQVVARSAPDGYTLLVVGPNHATNPSLFSQLPFDPIKDFTPASLLTSAPYVLVAWPGLEIRTFQDLLSMVKAKPGQLFYGSAGNGTAGHLAMEMIKIAAGLNITHVPYRGSPPMLTDVMSGQISVAFDNVLSSNPHIIAGNMRAIAVSGQRRAPLLKDVPTIAESGMPGFDVTVWQGLLLPAGMDPAITNKISREVRATLQAPDLQERLAVLGVEAFGSTPEAFGTFLEAEIRKWGTVIKQTGAKLD